MENSIKLKVANGLLSALLVAPIFASATTAMAQDTTDETATETERELIYHNNFSEENFPDDVAVASGNAVLEWDNNIEFEGNTNNSGVWVTNRENDYDGIDLDFDSLGLEAGREYDIVVQGFVGSEESIPDDTSINLETVAGYTWLNTTTPLGGEAFTLEASYSAFESEDDSMFRIKTNDAGVGMEFAITDILITAEEVVGEDDSEVPVAPEHPSDEDETDTEDDSSLETLYFNDFTENTNGAASAGTTFEHQPDFNEDQGALYVGDRSANWHGVDLNFEAMNMQAGYSYEVTIRGYVDEGVEVPDNSQALLQSPEGSYPLIAETDLVAGEMFELVSSYTWSDEVYENFRVQTNEVAATVPFYITEVLVEWNADQTPVEDEEPDPDAPQADEFTLIDFEDQELNGVEGRNGGEVLDITDAENHTEGGQYSLHVSNRQNDWHGPSLDVTSFINTGETYEVSAWVKVDEDTAQTITLSTQVGNDSPTYNNISSATLSAEDGWVEIRGEYRYTSLGGGYVSIYLESGNVNLDFYVDDINFEQIGSDPIEVDLELQSIQEAYQNEFTIGNIVSTPDLESPRLDLLTHHHSLVTAENAMKPDGVYDGREFDFSGVNSLVERVNEENLELHGHVLVWHSQSPEWHHTENGVTLSREEALENMRVHIRTVMENFGEIRSWDVVNEALDGNWENPEDWRSNLRNTGWLRAIGDDYIYQAFSYARQVADENGWDDMVLYYNDYNDHVQGKARTMYYMVDDINEQYAAENPDDSRKLISGLGMQGHYNIDINPENVKQSIERFEQLGIEIGITELDVTTNTSDQYVEAEWIRQGQVYARIFQIFREHSESINRVTFWGLNDANSWRSDRFPLLFDGSLRAKPAYYAVIDPDAFLEEYPLEDAVANQGYAVYGTPEINAEIDSIWNEAPVLNMNRMQQAHEILASGTGRVLWDEENLYVLYQVTDSILDISAEAAHEQDSVEAFVNETGEATTSYIDGVGQYRVNYENEASINPSIYGEGFQSATRMTGSGYVVEMAIPWKNVTPEAWETIGFDIQINDARDGARHGVAAWNDYTGGGWQDPSVFGELTLVNSLDDIPPVEIEVGVQTPILPGQVGVIGSGDATVITPADLPEGTEILVEYVGAEDLPTLEATGGYTLVVAGEVVRITLVYPEGSEDFEGEFTLTLGINDEFLGEEVFVYYYDEESGAWDRVGGDVADNLISINVTGFSMYGVFALEDDLDDDDTDVETPGEDDDSDVDAPGDDGTDADAPDGDDTDTDADDPDDIADGDDESEADVEDDTDEDTAETVVDSDDDDSAERLPQTATVIWTVGLLGLTGMVSGLGLHFLRKKK